MYRTGRPYFRAHDLRRSLAVGHLDRWYKKDARAARSVSAGPGTLRQQADK